METDESGSGALPGTQEVIICAPSSQAGTSNYPFAAVDAASYVSTVAVISGYVDDLYILVPSTVVKIDNSLVVYYEVPRDLIYRVGGSFIVASVLLKDQRIVHSSAERAQVQFHDSDMTGDTHLDTLDIIEAVDRFVQGEITFETVAQVIDDVATAATP